MAANCAQEAVAHLQEVHKELYVAAMMEIEATSDFNTLSERNAAVKSMLSDKKKEVDALDRCRMAARSKAEEAYRPLLALIAESKSDPVLEDFLHSISTTATPAEMEDEISAEKARLELTHEGNGAVIKEYEQRQKRVDALKETLEEGKGAFEEQAEHIRAVREQWEPELDKLVEKISKSFQHNMAQINCAGEVAVFKDENEFDNWAIQIMVKFRYVLPRLVMQYSSFLYLHFRLCSSHRFPNFNSPTLPSSRTQPSNSRVPLALAASHFPPRNQPS